MADTTDAQDQKLTQAIEAFNKQIAILNSNVKQLHPDHPKQQAAKRGSEGFIREFFQKHAAKEVEKHARRKDMGAADRIAHDLGQHKNVVKKSHKFISGAADKLAAATTKFSADADGMFNTLQTTLGAFVGGKIVASLLGSGRDMVKTYERLSDVGQSFGGSMIQMGAQAAAAGVPLHEFARQIERNSTVAAALANSTSSSRTSLGELSRAVRENIKQAGFFGMSIGEISDLTGDYAETMRLQGRAADINKDKTSRFIGSLAEEISDFASMTGKSKQDIAKDANSAMQSTSVLTAGLSGTQSDSLMKGVTSIAAMPGMFGSTISKAVADAATTQGGIWQTEVGKSLSSAGLNDLLPTIQKYAEELRDGKKTSADTPAFIKTLLADYDKNAGVLRSLQGSNAETRTWVENFSQVRGLNLDKTPKQIADAQRLDSISSFFVTLDDNLNSLGAAFHGGLFDVLNKTLNFDAKGVSQTFEAMKVPFAHLGEAVGRLISTVFTPGNIKAMGDGIYFITTLAADLFSGLIGSLTGPIGALGATLPTLEDTAKTYSDNIKKDAREVWQFFKNVLIPIGTISFHGIERLGGVVLYIMSALDSMQKWLHTNLGIFGDMLTTGALAASAALAIGALAIPRIIIKKLMAAGGMMFAKATINARDVVINGEALGAGGRGNARERQTTGNAHEHQTREHGQRDWDTPHEEPATAKKRRGLFGFRRKPKAVAEAAEGAEAAAHEAVAVKATARTGIIARLLGGLRRQGGAGRAVAEVAGGTEVAAHGAGVIKKALGPVIKATSILGKFAPAALGTAFIAMSAVDRAKQGDKFGAAVDGASAVLDLTTFGAPIAEALQAAMLARDFFHPFKAKPKTAAATPAEHASPEGPAVHTRSRVGSLALGGLGGLGAFGAATAFHDLHRDDTPEKALQSSYDSLTDSLNTDRRLDASQTGGDAYILGLRKIEEAVKEQTQIMMLLSKQGIELQRKGNQKQQEALAAASAH